MIKVIFIDMGNTLIHFHEKGSDEEKDREGIRGLTAFLKGYATEISESDVKAYFFEAWIDAMKDRKTDYIEVDVSIYINGLMSRYGVELNRTECIEAMNVLYKPYRENIVIEDKLRETMLKLKSDGYRIGVISNAALYSEVMIKCFEYAGIRDLIEGFVFSYDDGIGKPDISIFQKALEKFQISPQEAIMVGDNVQSDVEPARKLGMDTIWFNREGRAQENYKGTIITQLSQLPELIRHTRKNREGGL